MTILSRSVTGTVIIATGVAMIATGNLINFGLSHNAKPGLIAIQVLLFGLQAAVCVWNIFLFARNPTK